ncbi:hypothetical protein HBI30_073220 [Parastagonospora nodorum]|nr:hypothetical protein HBI30_073220 [Parastagonospora nodorum]
MHPTRALLAKNNLLICLDAFGTLFKPTQPIAATYTQAAAKHGIQTGCAENAQQVGNNFAKAFKDESARNPNYGKRTGLGAQAWWENVIRSTFTPFLKPGQSVPPALTTELWQHFSTGAPYSLYPDVKDFFLELRKYKATGPTEALPWKFEKVVVGIISNSDDRAVSILEGMGLDISPRRVGKTSPTTTQNWSRNDIDFVALSYDVGHEKPDHHIFDAATSLLDKTLAEQAEGLRANDFEKLYLGDDLEKDYFGALAAGWYPVLIDRKGVMDRARGFRFGTVGTTDKQGEEVKVSMAQSLLDLDRWEPKVPEKTTMADRKRW